jgi:hypothetical protein
MFAVPFAFRPHSGANARFPADVEASSFQA